MFIGIHDKLVDKCMFTTLLTQLLVKVLQNYLLKPNCLYTNNMKTWSMLTVAHLQYYKRLISTNRKCLQNYLCIAKSLLTRFL